jgi:hypothetical protein
MKISGCTNNLKRTTFNAHNKDNILYKFMLTSVKMHMQIQEEPCLSKVSTTYNHMKHTLPHEETLLFPLAL